MEIYTEIDPICLVPGPNSTKFGRAHQMDFIPLANLTLLGGKWGEITHQELSVYKNIDVLEVLHSGKLFMSLFFHRSIG